jgi:hypothetical protein
LKDKQGDTVGYIIEGQGEVTVEKAIKLAAEGALDNVVIVTNKNGGTFLRSKKNNTSEDNFSV